MKKTVHQHVDRILELIKEIETDREQAKSELEKMQLDNELKQLRLAIQHFELALEIEQSVAEQRKGRTPASGNKH